MGVAALLGVTTACGSREPVCATADATLVPGDDAISCDDVRVARRYAEALSARSLTQPQRDRMFEELQDAARKDASRVQARLKAAQAVLDGFAEAEPLDAARARSQHIYALATDGVFPEKDWPSTYTAIDASVAIWNRDEATKLVLTEMDIEGWIRYASLAREVQGASPLRVSMADRVSVYRVVQDAWEHGSTDDKLALNAIGAYWPHLRNRWKAASYDTQQGWIRRAPLPPPMTATSMGYLDVLTEDKLPQHAAILLERLKPPPISEAW